MAVELAKASRTRFEEALEVKSFGERCHALTKIGKDIKAAGLQQAQVEEILDVLLPNATADSVFEEKARLILAKATGCHSYAKKLLGHASRAVRFEAARGGLLAPEDARAAFLSSTSSRKLKQLLVGYYALPCDDATIAEAWGLFGKNDRHYVWELLVRATNEELLRAWLLEPSAQMNQWLSLKTKSPPFLPQLARRFPLLMIDLVKDCCIKWGWYWAKDVVQTHAREVLCATFIDKNSNGSGPLKGYDPREHRQNWKRTLASWGWRHQPDLMLAMCKELAAEKDVDAIEDLAGFLMEVSSTRHYLTTSERVGRLTHIWSCVPVSEKQPKLAKQFVSMLPSNVKEHRTKELDKITEAFWKFLAEVGRTGRRELLVGEEARPSCTGTLKAFMSLLPPPLAVTQFFKVVAEFDAATPAYEFMQTTICKSKTKDGKLDGRHDELMQRIFGQYLRKKELNVVQACSLFTKLVEDARSRDVIQASFDLLVQCLGGKMELGLMQKVVRRMYALEMESSNPATAELTPKASLPPPVHWVRLAKLPKSPAPRTEFLLHVLHTGTGEKDLLGAMLKKYGSSFFWDALGEVLRATGEIKGKPPLLQQQEPVPDLQALSQINVAAVLAPITQAQLGSARAQEDIPSVYFSALEETKRKTLGKDPQQRSAGYVELIGLAGKDKDPSKAFADLLVFLLGRFTSEQKEGRMTILSELLQKQKLPLKLWKESLVHLRGFWKAARMARGTDFTHVWFEAGRELVREAWREWEDSSAPTESYEFGLEVSSPKLQLPQEFAALHKKHAEGGGLSIAAAKDVFERSVPLQEGTTLERFWVVLTNLSTIAEGKGEQQELWDRWPFVSARWKALLQQGIEQKAIKYAFIDIFDLLNKGVKARPVEKRLSRQWWAPIDCTEYANIVNTILAQMVSGEIPTQIAAPMLACRIELLIEREQMTVEAAKASGEAAVDWRVWGRKHVPRFEFRNLVGRDLQDLRLRDWVQHVKWDIAKHHQYTPIPWASARCRERVASLEVGTLHKLLSGAGEVRRQVLWQVVQVAANLTGPSVSALLELAISGLDARFEGMARSVARHYPYLNAALAKDQKQDGCCDVLTPLVEMWLLDDATRDERVQAIMRRSDFHYFLFFGVNFSRHVSNVRQQWLHQCLEKIRGLEEGPPEFYHFKRRGPCLHQVAQFGQGWRHTLLCESGGESLPSSGPGSVQVFLWHPSTQVQFLQKSLFSTDATCLALIPKLSLADSHERVTKVLASYPSEDGRAEVPSWDWEVIQAIGAYSDIKLEIERRFSELSAPKVYSVVQSVEVEALVISLGRADIPTTAVKLISNVSGKKLKPAKVAVTKQIMQLSPLDARELVKQVMLPRKAGVGLQTAGLKLLAELQLPEPLDLYKTAWSKGKCPRDVAGIILSKVNSTSQFRPEEVRGFFNFFKDMADEPEECIYVAKLLLEQLAGSPQWSLPFLPDVVTDLAMLPSLTIKAMDALKTTRSHVTETVQALTKMVRVARLAARADQDASNKSGEVLYALSQYTTFAHLRQIALSVSLMDLEACEPLVLTAFVDEMLRQWQRPAKVGSASEAVSVLMTTLSVWVKLLRTGQASAWPNIIAAMEARVARWGTSSDLTALAKCLTDAVPHMKMNPGEREVMIKTSCDFFERLMEEHLCRREPEDDPMDDEFEKMEEERQSCAESVLEHWADLLAQGCTEVETTRLLGRVPDHLRIHISTRIVKASIAELQSSKLAQFRQRRPDEGWRHEGGFPVEDVKVGSVVEGKITNSSLVFGVFVDFGCVKDGRLELPANEWKNYRVGDEVKGMIVNKVDIKPTNQFIQLIRLSEKGSQPEGQFLGWDVALRVVKWLGVDASVKLRRKFFCTLTSLWASVVALNCGNLEFKECLALLGMPLPQPKDSVLIIEALLKETPAQSLAREALKWLGQSCPEDAIRLWPELLQVKDDSVEIEDVDALLTFCEAQGLELPTLDMSIALSLSEEALARLAASRLPEARLLVIHALWERHFEPDEVPATLERLKVDESEIVAAAAQSLLARLTEPSKSPGERVSGESDDSDETDGTEDKDSDW